MHVEKQRSEISDDMEKVLKFLMWKKSSIISDVEKGSDVEKSSKISEVVMGSEISYEFQLIFFLIHHGL